MPNLRGYDATSSPLLKKALDYNKLNTAPDNWRMASDGKIHQLQGAGDNVDDAPLVGTAEPNSAPGSGFWGQFAHALPYMGLAVGMGVPGALMAGSGGAGEAAGALSSAGAGEAAAAGGAGATAALGPSTAASMAATQAATAAPSSLMAAGGAGAMGWKEMLMSSLLGGKGGGTTAILSALSMLGGPNGPESYSGTGITDPVEALKTALTSTARLGQGMTERSPVKLRSSYVQAPPAPVTIPGLPFQIGGGMGRDPALSDPSLLQSQDRGNPFKYDPFQSQDSTGSNGSKLRKP